MPLVTRNTFKNKKTNALGHYFSHEMSTQECKSYLDKNNISIYEYIKYIQQPSQNIIDELNQMLKHSTNNFVDCLKKMINDVPLVPSFELKVLQSHRIFLFLCHFGYDLINNNISFKNVVINKFNEPDYKLVFNKDMYFTYFFQKQFYLLKYTLNGEPFDFFA